jgi:hypothetical protein
VEEQERHADMGAISESSVKSSCSGLPGSQENKKPEGMSEEEWTEIKKMSPDLKQTFFNIWELRVQRGECLDSSNKPASSTKHSFPPSQDIIPFTQISLCSEMQRVSPNSFLRSAIFPAIQGRTRRYLKNELIAAQNGYEIRFTGMMLDQADFDVWLQATHLAKGSPMGTICIVTAYSFLKTLGRKNGKSDYEWLKNSLLRLQSGIVEIKTGVKWVRLNLLNQVIGNDETTHIKLQFNTLLLQLFGSDWTALQWEERRQLKTKPLALWLQGYFASHAAPYPVKVSTLMRMCGSETKRLRRFKEALKKAFDELTRVTGIKATLDGDLVVVQKTPSPTQAKHLLKKAPIIKQK